MTDEELADDYLDVQQELEFLRWMGDRVEMDKVYWEKERLIEKILERFVELFGRRGR